MRLVPPGWNRRLPLAAVALVFAAGNLVFFLGYRSSTSERRAALEARRDDLARAVASREAEAERLAVQKERLSGVSEAMEEFYGRRIGTQEETLAGLVADLHGALKEAGIEANQVSYTTAPVSKLPLTRMKISFPVKCDYGRFKRLLRIFETGRRWIAVESVAIRRDAEQPGAVYVQMDLATYFAERELPPPAASGKTPGPAVPARGTVPAASSKLRSDS
jgi:Tfp pilus assembly protein PilO